MLTPKALKVLSYSNGVYDCILFRNEVALNVDPSCCPRKPKAHLLYYGIVMFETHDTSENKQKTLEFCLI